MKGRMQYGSSVDVIAFLSPSQSGGLDMETRMQPRDVVYVTAFLWSDGCDVEARMQYGGTCCNLAIDVANLVALSGSLLLI